MGVQAAGMASASEDRGGEPVRTGDVLPRFAVGSVAAVVVAQAAVLTALSGRYGFHRDELYFLTAGQHPAWGYIDQPPLTPLLARASTAVFGESPTGLRVAATLLAAATVVVVALVAREFGGGRAVQVAAGVSTALAGFVLVVSHMVSTTTVDVLVWVVVCLLVLRLLRTGNPRWWIAIGVAVGIGLDNKWLVPLLVVALGIALVAVGPRSVLRSWWLAVGAVVAAAVVAPVFAWQAAHDFPLLTVADGISGKDGASNRALFVPMQFLYLSPVLVPVWVAGLVRLWRDPGLRWARAMVVGYPILCAAVIILGGKPYYAVPILLVFTAAGFQPSLQWLRAHGRRARRTVAATLAAIGAAISVIIGLPVLPASLLNGPVLAMNKEAGEQVGWPEFTATVAGVWQQIPPGQRGTAVIFTANYGEAGAIDHYGGAYSLPTPYSGHMSFADWGPPADRMDGPVVVVGDFGPTAPIWHAVNACHQAAVIGNTPGVDNDENEAPVYLCTGPSQPWSRSWPTLRHGY